LSKITLNNIKKRGSNVSDLTYSSKKFSKSKLCIDDKRLILLIIILLIFSILDGLFTLWGLRLQLIEEGNPLMQQLINHKPIALMSVKIFLPIFLGAVMWYIRNTSRKLVSYGLGIILTGYSGVMILHGYWIIYVLISF
jgi:hypothetical protein